MLPCFFSVSPEADCKFTILKMHNKANEGKKREANILLAQL